MRKGTLDAAPGCCPFGLIQDALLLRRAPEAPTFDRQQLLADVALCKNNAVKFACGQGILVIIQIQLNLWMKSNSSAASAFQSKVGKLILTFPDFAL